VPDAAAGGARRRGLLVDWGGVLTSNLFHSFTAHFETLGIPADNVRELFRSRPAAREALVALETGRMDESEFEVRLAAALELEDHAGLVDGLMAGAVPDVAMVRAVERARAAGLRTGLISNSWGTHRYGDDTLARLFDITVISGLEGTRKPDPRMYELALERIGLAGPECVFVDDLEFNLGPAEQLGMATVLHHDAAETVPELERLLGIPLG
jgi:putative hydrolase of the HAD superfamily